MKKLILLFPIVLTACVSTPVINQVDMSKVDFEELLNQKMGQSCQGVLFGFIPVGPGASVAKAAWNAEIKKVSYVETSYTNILIIQESCVRVYGE